jgi:hypothetical protein
MAEQTLTQTNMVQAAAVALVLLGQQAQQILLEMVEQAPLLL